VISEDPFHDASTTIRVLRESRRMSQAKLADRCDFDHSYISRLESSGRNPTRDALERISLALGLNASEEAKLMESGGFVPMHRTQEQRDWSELFSLMHDPAIRPDIRDAGRLMMAGLLNLLRVEKNAPLSHTGGKGGTVVRTESADGKHVVTVEQPLPGEPTL
jgi:transcriptional regulator with XRE-family HTH domain